MALIAREAQRAYLADPAPGPAVQIQLPPGTNPALAASLQHALQRTAVVLAGHADVLMAEADRIAHIAVGLAEPELDLLEERIRRRDTVLKVFTEGDWLTAEQINALQPTPPQNKAHPASDWKRRGRIFSVTYSGREYFARYQFDALLQPLPVLKRVLQAYGEVADTWTLAAWFHYPNAWLAEHMPAGVPAGVPAAETAAAAAPRPLAPKDALDQGEAVVAAASKRRGTYQA